MHQKDIPQDKSALDNVTKDVIYALDENGNYTTALSRGWQVKVNALDVAWQEVQQRIEEAREKVKAGDASPILFFMELRLMDTSILADYTGYWQWQIKRHLKLSNFKKLSDKKLKKYADAFEITVEELKTFTGK